MHKMFVTEGYIRDSLNSLMEKYLPEGLDDIYNKYYAELLPNREDFNTIIAIDPTYNPNKDKMGSYGQWLLNQLKKGEDVFGEANEYKDQLRIFNSTKNKLPQDQRDISRIKTLRDLMDLNASMEETTNKSEFQLKAEKFPGAKFIGKNDNWEVYQPESYEASKFLRGDDAIWCTGRHNDDHYWRSYTRDGGKLFIFINTSGNTDANNVKYQVAIRDGRVTEFRDARNNSAKFLQFINDSDLLDALSQTEIAQTKDYKAVKQIKETNGEILYTALMAIKSNVSESEDVGTLFDALQSSIKTIVVDDGIRILIPYCFDGMRAENIILPESVQSLGKGCFKNCINLKSIKIPNKVTTIPSGCFIGCEKLTSVEFGNNVIDIKGFAFDKNSPELKIKTTHHRITILKSEIDFYKKHIEWVEELKEELLTEKLSEHIPSWLRKYLTKDYKSNYRKAYGVSTLLNELSHHGIDLSKVEIKSIRKPESYRDPIFTDNSKILIFRIPKETAEANKDARNWSNVENDIIYVKGVNHPAIGYYSTDSLDNKSTKRLLALADKMAYIDMNNPENFNKDKKQQRAAAKDGYIDRNVGKQKHDYSYILVPRDKSSGLPVLHIENRDDDWVQRLYSDEDISMAWWYSDERQGGTTSDEFKEFTNKPIKDFYQKPKKEYKDTWITSNHFDKSGFDISVSKHNLKLKLNDYRKKNYQRTLDTMQENLNSIKGILSDYINSSLDNIDDDVDIEGLFKQFKRCLKEYNTILSRIDYIEHMDNKEEQEKQIDQLFSIDGRSRWSSDNTFTLSVKDLADDIITLKRQLQSIETTYIEEYSDGMVKKVSSNSTLDALRKLSSLE